MDNIALLREIHEPFERGESDDYQPIWDIVAEDVVYESPVGQILGRQAMIDYFTNVAEIAEFSPFERPIEYFGDGDRVVMTSEELIKDLRTGATTRGDWVWIIDMRNGQMARVVHFLHFDENLSVIMGPLTEAYERTTASAPS